MYFRSRRNTLGYDGTRYYSDLFIFDMVHLSWSSPSISGHKPPAREGHSLTPVYGGHLLTVGGFDGIQTRTDAYTLSTDSISLAWSTLYSHGMIPGPRQGHSMTLAHGPTIKNKILLFGGLSSGKLFNTYYNEFYELDITTMQWKQRNMRDLPEKRRGHSATMVGEKLFVFGGEGEAIFQRKALNDMHILDCERLTWSPITSKKGVSSPPPRFHHSATAVNNNILIYGGRNEYNTHLSDIYAFDTETHEWKIPQIVGHLPDRSSHSAVYAPTKNKLIIFGGENQQRKTNDLIILDMETSVVSFPKPSLNPDERSGHTAVLSTNHKYMHVVGGSSSVSMAELWVLDIGNQSISPP